MVYEALSPALTSLTGERMQYASLTCLTAEPLCAKIKMKTMRFLCSFLLFLLLISCERNSNKIVTQSETLSTQNVKKELPSGIENEKTTKLVDNQLRHQELLKLLNRIGFIELPYIANYPTNSLKKNVFNCSQEKISLLKDFYGNHIEMIGFIPDTTNFYAILYITLETTQVPNLITFDKQGTLIDRKAITEENSWLFPGYIIKCEEYTRIEKDLTLNYFFMMIHDYESFDKNDEDIRFKLYEKGLNDSVSYKRFMYHYEKTGRILSTGKIEFDTLNKIKVREVVKIENE